MTVYGRIVGAWVGSLVGAQVGPFVVGDKVGYLVGEAVVVGAFVGSLVGRLVVAPSGSWSQCGSLGCYAGVGGTTDPGPLAVGGASRWVALELVAMLRAPSRNASETALRVGLCKIPATIPVHSVNARKETSCRHLAKSRSRTLHGVDPPTCGWIRTDNHGTFEISDLGNHTTSTGIASDVAERTRSLAFACQDGRGWDS